MGSVRLAVILSIALLGLGADQGDRLSSLVTNADQISGPWETSAGSGIQGIYIKVSTAATQPGSASAQTPPWQTFEVNVYRRRGGETTNGWFDAEYKPTPDASVATPENSALSFSNNHLRVVLASGSDLSPLDIDLTFAPAKHAWTGTWKVSGETLAVSLTRPEDAQHTGADPIVGDWEGYSSARNHPTEANTSICIRRSADGVLSAWMNRDLTQKVMDMSGSFTWVGDARSAEPLRVVSFDKNEIHLALESAGGGHHEYVGKLSGDGNSLTGSWQGGGGTLTAQFNFHRATK